MEKYLTFSKKLIARILGRNLNYLLLALIISLAQITYAQVTVSGTVTDDETGEPITGATVVQKGTTNGTATDIDGKYTLSIPSDAIIVFSFIGYQSQEITVNSQTVINVSLMTDTQMLQEVVVVDYGYGTVEKTDFTGSVASISGEEIKQIPIASTEQALTGRLPGVSVLSTDGEPGADVVIRIRGGGSVTQSNAPLYVVDGFIVGNIRDIPPSDIESINVLKDAAAVSIYGPRAANGVIVITTTTARAGKVSVNYNGFFQAKFLPDSRDYDVLSPYEYVLANYEQAKLNSESATRSFERLYGTYEDLELYKMKPGSDWEEELMGDPQYSYFHNFSVSGGTDLTKFNLSLTSNDDEGVIPNNGYTRNVLNFKLNQKLSDKITLNAQTRITNTVKEGAGTSGGSQLKIKDLIQTAPVNGIADNLDLDLGSVANDNDYTSYLLSRLSPVELLEQDWRQVTDNNYVFNADLTWEAIDGLNLKTTFTSSTRFRDQRRFYGPQTSESFNNGGNLPIGTKYNRQQNSFRWLNTAQYSFPMFEDTPHDLKVLVGNEIYSENRGSEQYIRLEDFRETITPEELFANLVLGRVDDQYGRDLTEVNRLGFLGRTDYQYLNKYLLTFTFRYDKSSIFREGLNSALFPAVALGWQIQEEPFMSGVSFVDELKLRLSYGEAGNDRLPANAARFVFVGSTTRGPGFNNVDNVYYTPSGSVLANPDLIWETTKMSNVGIDFSLFTGKVSGSLDAYYNQVDDLILQNAIPSQTGFSTQYDNIGSTSNRGIELGLTGYAIDNNDLRVIINANFGMNRGRIEDFGDATERFYASHWASTDLNTYTDFYAKEGGNVGDIFGYVTDGFYTTDDFQSYDPVSDEYTLKEGVPNSTTISGNSNIRPGFLKLKDISGPDGTPDGIVDDFDRKVIGNALPKAQGGIGFDVFWKNFDASVFFNWDLGSDVYNANKIQFSQFRRVSYGNLLNSMNSSNRFTYIDIDGSYTGTPGGLVTDLADLTDLNEGKNIWNPYTFGGARAVIHSWAIEDGSFIRLNQLSIGYTVPKSMLSKIKVNSVRVYGTGNNLMLWTKYTGYDPEVSKVRNSREIPFSPRMDDSAFPRSIAYSVGVNITF